MPDRLHYNWVLRLVTKAAGAFRANDWTLSRIDPDGLKYLATISVRAHWFIAAIALIEINPS